jgi:hypothetical protein
MFVGQREVKWSALPCVGVVLVSFDIPTGERRSNVSVQESSGVRPSRKVGLLTRVTLQLFTMAHEPITEETDVEVANEITLGQLVLEFVMLGFEGRIDARASFHWDIPRYKDGHQVGDGIHERNSRTATSSRLSRAWCRSSLIARDWCFTSNSARTGQSEISTARQGHS